MLQNIHNNISEILISIIDNIHIGLKGIGLNNSPRLNLLYYVPQINSFYQFISFKPMAKESLPGMKSGIFLECMEHLNKKVKIISEKEITLLINNGLKYNGINQLLDELRSNNIGNILKTNPNNESLLRSIYNIFNDQDVAKIEMLEKQEFRTTYGEQISFLQPILYLLLSVTPQYNQNNASINYPPLAIQKWKTYKSKRDDTIALINLFNSEKLSMSFSERLYLLLTIVESMQWKSFTNFWVVNDTFRYFYDKIKLDELGYEKSQFLVNNIEIYIYDDNPLLKAIYDEKNEYTKNYKAKQIIKTIIKNNLPDLSSQLWKLMIQNYIDNIKNNNILKDDLSKALCEGFLHFIYPEYIGLGSKSERGSQDFFKENDLELKRRISPYLPAMKNYFENSAFDNYFTIQDVDPKKIKILKLDDCILSITDEDRTLKIISEPWMQSQNALAFQFSGPQDFEIDYFNIISSSKKSFEETLDSLVEGYNRALLESNYKEWYKHAFGNLYKKFDEKRHTKEKFRTIRSGEISFLTKQIEEIHIPLVIDIGCGYGRVAKQLLEANEDLILIGIDYSFFLLEEAKKLVDRYKERIKIIQKNMLDITKSDNSYPKDADLVIFMFTTFGYFEHDDDNIEVLRRAYNLLKKGGVLIIEQYNPENNEFFESPLTPQMYEDNIDDIKLIKTSFIVLQNEYTQYSGYYYYYDLKYPPEKLRRIDYYKIKLYKANWFQNAFKSIDSEVDIKFFYGSFKDGFEEKEIKNKPNPQMIVRVQRKSDNTIEKFSEEEIYSFITTFYNRINSAKKFIIKDDSNLQNQIVKFFDDHTNYEPKIAIILLNNFLNLYDILEIKCIKEFLIDKIRNESIEILNNFLITNKEHFKNVQIE